MGERAALHRVAVRRVVQEDTRCEVMAPRAGEEDRRDSDDELLVRENLSDKHARSAVRHAPASTSQRARRQTRTGRALQALVLYVRGVNNLGDCFCVLG